MFRGLELTPTRPVRWHLHMLYISTCSTSRVELALAVLHADMGCVSHLVHFFSRCLTGLVFECSEMSSCRSYSYQLPSSLNQNCPPVVNMSTARLHRLQWRRHKGGLRSEQHQSLPHAVCNYINIHMSGGFLVQGQ